MMTPNVRLKLTCVLVGSAIGLGIGAPRVGAAPDNWHCEATALTWDAPYASVVVSRTTGPIATTLDSLGEFLSHVVLSFGPHWATQASMWVKSSADQPEPRGYPNICSKGTIKTNALKYGYPGAQTVTASGMWAFYHNDSEAPLEWIGRVNPQYTNGVYPWDDIYAAKDAADFLNYDVAWESIGNERYRAWYLGETFPYYLHQYRDIQGRYLGDRSSNNGVHCSSWVSWAVAKGNPGKYVDRTTIPHSGLITAGSSIYNGVRSHCEDGEDGWQMAAEALCGESLCDDTARQVRRCMLTAACSDDSNDKWNEVKADPNSIARSISPQKLVGWAPHSGSFNGINNKRGPWSAYPAHGVTFSGGGTWYGCW